MDTVFIYGLNDPRTGKCRYVGKATNCVKRFQAHIDRCHDRATHKNCWIKGLLALGLKPVLEVIDEVPTTEWKFWEQEYIRVWRAIGFNLTNILPGGEGQPKGHTLSVETRAKMSAARRGKVKSEETKRKISAAQTGERGHWFGKRMPDSTKEKMSLSHRARHAKR